jgi:beta-aspartyl-peptidase (threonine type)
MDALIMDGQSLSLGAVAAVQRVRNPISLARRVMTDSGHAFLVGYGAELFADAIRFPRCEVTDLLVGEDLEAYLARQSGEPIPAGAASPIAGPKGDTVGAVALDWHGNIAAATSTGGTRKKQPGRVGDSPLVGAGAYADNRLAAVSATGYGEAIMKVLLSKQVCDLVGLGLSPQGACEAAMRLFEERTGSDGGVIAVDARGDVGYAYNTTAMPHAWARGTDPVQSGR